MCSICLNVAKIVVLEAWDSPKKSHAANRWKLRSQQPIRDKNLTCRYGATKYLRHSQKWYFYK
jgi:hypothetical protein